MPADKTTPCGTPSAFWQTFEARQAMFDRTQRVVAYELVLRPSGSLPERVGNGRSRAIGPSQRDQDELNTAAVLGDLTCYLRMPRHLLQDPGLRLFEREQIVLEIGRDIEPDEDLLTVIEPLAHEGFQFAIDGFLAEPYLEQLMPMAQTAVLDMRRHGTRAFKDRTSLLQTRGLRLVARSVDGEHQFKAARELGFSLFLGAFLERPKLRKGHASLTSRLQVLPLINRLHQRDFDLQDLERFIAEDVTLSYELLRLINSPYYGLSQPVDSVRRAVVYLGRDSVRNWITLLSLRGTTEQKSHFLGLALVRGRMCQLLAEAMRLPGREHYFTAGLFSALDLLLGTSMTKILGKLPMNDEINAALLHREGPIGAALGCTLAFERESTDSDRQFQDLDVGHTGLLYLTALAWVQAHQGSIGDGH